MRLSVFCEIRFMSEDTAIKIYKTMIRPHLEYIDFIVEPGTNDKVDKFDKLQDCIEALQKNINIVSIGRISMNMMFLEVSIR